MSVFETIAESNPFGRKRRCEAVEDEEEETSLKAPRRTTDDRPPRKKVTADETWRGDPAETYSDWKIEIVTTKEVTIEETVDDEEEKQDSEATVTKKENDDDEIVDGKEKEASDSNQTGFDVEDEHEGHGENSKETTKTKMETVVTTYNVHRYTLARGDRSSAYFAGVFKNGNKFREGDSFTSRIELHPLAAAAFPALLDYLYEPDKDLKIDVNSAVALHFLGEYFEMESLRWDVKEYCKENINMENAATFYEHCTKEFPNSSILDLVEEFLGKHILLLNPNGGNSDIIKVSDSHLWLNVMKYVNHEDQKASQHASSVVTTFLSMRCDTLDAATFRELTSDENMVHLDPHSTLSLCDLDDYFALEEGEVEPNEVTSLQKRCATAIAELPIGILHQKLPNPQDLATLQERKPAFLVDLFMKTLKQGSQNHNTCLNELRVKTEALDSAQAVIRSFQPVTGSKNGHQIFGEQHTQIPAELRQFNSGLAATASFGFVERTTGYFGGEPQSRTLPVFYYDPRAAIRPRRRRNDDAFSFGHSTQAAQAGQQQDPQPPAPFVFGQPPQAGQAGQQQNPQPPAPFVFGRMRLERPAGEQQGPQPPAAFAFGESPQAGQAGQQQVPRLPGFQEPPQAGQAEDQEGPQPPAAFVFGHSP